MYLCFLTVLCFCVLLIVFEGIGLFSSLVTIVVINRCIQNSLFIC